MSENDEIKTAKTAGFCWGVKRAMDMTLETAKAAEGPVHTHGPLIHNPQVIEMLEGKSVYAIEDATRLDEGTVIIRTHGITPTVRGELKQSGLKISDATCPLVARVQGIIKKHANHGYHVVIIGDKGHAEVIGLLGYSKEGMRHVIGSVEEAEHLPEMDNVCVVAQTTCDTTKYKGIVETLRQRYPGAVITDTICEATQDRQEEVLDIANKVDLMVVVGGRNSANTNRLAELARAQGTETVLIESEEDIDEEQVARSGTVGLTAGASTPTWMIERVTDRIKHIRKEKPAPHRRFLRRFGEAFVVGNLNVALGAAFMVFANSVLGGYGFSWRAAFIASAYLFSMYTLNHLNDTQTFKHNEPEKLRFFLKHRRLIVAAAYVAAISSLLVSFTLNVWAAAVYVGAMALGLGYTVKWFPRSGLIRIHRLKDIPASKDVFVGVGWVAVTVLIPAMAAGAELIAPPVAVALAFTFTIVYIRQVVSDIRDIHGDRLVGRETIPILIGKEWTKIFVAALTLALAALLVAASVLGWAPGFGLLLLLSVGYTAMYLALYHVRIISRGPAFDVTVDGVFHVTGLLAIIWVYFLSG